MSAKPQPPQPSKPAALTTASRDALSASLRRIDAIAGLLGTLADRMPSEPLDADLVGEATEIITEETAQIRAALATAIGAK